jgi:hypothetical protein
MYQLIITKDGTEVENLVIDDVAFSKIKKAITVKPKPVASKTVKPKFEDLGEDDFEDDIYDEDGKINLELVKECLEDSDYIQWNDKTGEKDNKKPFRLLINKKFLIEFEVSQGICIEATWEHRIWDAEISSIKLVQTLEIEDKAKETINAFEKSFGKIEVRNIPDYSRSGDCHKDIIDISGSATKWMNRYHDIDFRYPQAKFTQDLDDAKLQKFDIQIKEGTVVYDLAQSEHFFVFKLKPEDIVYYSVEYKPESRYSSKIYEPILGEDEVLLFNDIYKVINKHEIGELVGIQPHWTSDDVYLVGGDYSNPITLTKDTLVYDVKELNSKGGTILFKLNPDDDKFYLSNFKKKYKFA